MAYAPPTLSQVQIRRCTAAGVEAEDGNYYSAKATATFSALGGLNALTLTAAHKIQGGVYGTETVLTSGAAAIIGTISPDSTYQVRITATDALGNTAVTVTSLPTRQWALKFRSNGQGAAFGKAAETDKALEIPADWIFKIGSNTLTAELLASMAADITHPVGMYVWLAVETDPATLWGGTWVRQPEGLTLVSAGGNYPLNSTGGEATHTLTIAEMPYHQHQMVNGNNGGYDYSGWTKSTIVLSDATKGWAGNANTSYVGDSAAHNNMMPYKAAYCWLRTA